MPEERKTQYRLADVLRKLKDKYVMQRRLLDMALEYDHGFSCKAKAEHLDKLREAIKDYRRSQNV